MSTLQLNAKLQSRLGVPIEQLAEFCHRWQVAELALFGSILRDDFSPESDIDRLISYQPTAKRGLFETVRMRDELLSLLHRNVDLMSKVAIENSPNWRRRKTILNSAAVIYVAEYG